MSIHRFMAFVLVAIWTALNLLALPAVVVEWFIRYVSLIPSNTLWQELGWVYLRKPELLFEYLTEGEVE